MIKGDLHIHSSFSFDSFLKPSVIINSALRKGLDFVAITDHNTIQGGLEASKATTSLKVIVGAEIKTEKGDILGLFLKKEIKSRKASEVMREIYQQGGIAILPHPFKKELKFCKDELVKFDALEINARMSHSSNERVVKLAKELGKKVVAGSDAHFSWEIGKGLNYLSSENMIKDSMISNIAKTEVNKSSCTNILFSYLTGKVRSHAT